MKNKSVKNFSFLIVTILFCLNLIACDPVSYHYKNDELINNVVAVELIDYDNTEIKNITPKLFEKRAKVIPFDFNKMEIIETMISEKIDDFLECFCEINFLRYGGLTYSNSPNGISIKITYKNGDFEIVSYNAFYAGRFDSEGNVKEFVGGIESSIDFKNLVNQYFETRIN